MNQYKNEILIVLYIGLLKCLKVPIFDHVNDKREIFKSLGEKDQNLA
jgi:hypothetical protein